MCDYYILTIGFIMFTLSTIVISSLSLGQMAIAIVIIAAVCALLYVALQQFGITIPSWVQQVGGIMVVAMVVIVAIRFVMSL